MQADDDGSFPGVLGFRDEDVCSDFMVVYCFVGNLNEAEVGDFGVCHGVGKRIGGTGLRLLDGGD